MTDETPEMVRVRIDNRDDQGRIVETHFYEFWGVLPMTEEKLRAEIYRNIADLQVAADVDEQKIPLAGPWLLDFVVAAGGYIAAKAADGIIGDAASDGLKALFRRLFNNSPSLGPDPARMIWTQTPDEDAAALAIRVATMRVDILFQEPFGSLRVVTVAFTGDTATVVLDAENGDRYHVTVSPPPDLETTIIKTYGDG